MIFVDANLLIYAEDADSPFHPAVRVWWDNALNGSDPLCLSWPVLNAFLRIRTSARIFRQPLTLAEASARIDAWLAQPCVRIVHATDRHWAVFRDLLKRGKAPASLVGDAHLAALAIQHNCVLYSTDADFSRFPGLRWRNPLAR